jgi:hypothetical protein
MESTRTRPAGDRGVRRPVLAAAAAVLTATTVLTAVPAAHASVPSPPAGWSQVFADDFDGPANAAPSSANWQFDLGHSYPGGEGNWGTGEIEEMTSNPANIGLDGGGNLRIRAPMAGRSARP